MTAAHPACTPEADRFQSDLDVPDPPKLPKGRLRYWNDTVQEAVAELPANSAMATRSGPPSRCWPSSTWKRRASATAGRSAAPPSPACRTSTTIGATCCRQRRTLPARRPATRKNPILGGAGEVSQGWSERSERNPWTPWP